MGWLRRIVEGAVEAMAIVPNSIGADVLFGISVVAIVISIIIVVIELSGRTFKGRKGFPFLKVVRYEQPWHPRFIGIVAILAALKIVLRVAGMAIPVIPGVCTLEFSMFFMGVAGTVFGMAGVIGYGLLGTPISDIFVGTLNIASIGGALGAFVTSYMFFKFKPNPKLVSGKAIGNTLLATFAGIGFLDAFSTCGVYQILGLLPVEAVWGFALPLYYVMGVIPALIGFLILVQPVWRLADRYGFTWKDLGYKIKGE